ncbi:uncharacterized protein L203_101134 [Cryptococcus depauperatus CBS 7841]|uniref:Mitochondrial import inner membrane translocase subunit TIM54 n=1 Tax=Cryptococcus depauperatus CBS 7841 TaxID=1295531 RepID=A0A1E3IMQ7_9TREE|nr:mitochondrial import inner membrane translocase subunit TIM54 [Cryptococcus depauperatus CBS 7841]
MKTPPKSALSNEAALKAAPAELTGFRSALAHTGIPHNVLTYKPKLPSRNWLVFWSITFSLSYAYYYDIKECKRIKQQTIARVEKYSREPTPGGSLGEVRKVTVWGGRWGGDEDADRAPRYFRKYVKPYLVAAGIDYNIPPVPLHGSITRQIHASVLAQRRQALGLAPAPIPLSLPGVLDPAEQKKRELEGGVVLVGRASLKEYLEGLRRGWENGVGEWEWEKEVEARLAKDGIFDEPKNVELDHSTTMPVKVVSQSGSTDMSASTPKTSLAFLSRPSSPSVNPAIEQIPAQLHIPPNHLPPIPPILLLPFINHMGFKQVPNMIYDFFTERYKVRQGAEAALSLIEGTTVPLTGQKVDSWDRTAEAWYNKTAKELPTRIQKAREDYYTALEPRIANARAYEAGEREMTEEEKKAGKVEHVKDLKEERQKKELRWIGNEEGWDIVKPETEPTWRTSWEGWIKVYSLPEGVKDTGL